MTANPPPVPQPAQSRARRRHWRMFWRRQDGSAAVEFGIVAIPFLAMLFAIIETAVVFFAGQTLETAVADSGRLIMTGQAQSQKFDKAAFKTALCSRLPAMIECSKVSIAVQTFTTFSQAANDADVNDPSTLVDANGNFKNFPYSAGCPGDIVVVRAMYQWPIFVSLLGISFADMPGNKRLLLATSAFSNEPYSNSCS